MNIKMKLNRFLSRTILVTGVLLGSFAGRVNAYNYSTCHGGKIIWNNFRADMYISTKFFPANSNWDTKLQNAMWNWNNVEHSFFRFYVGRTDGNGSSGNGVTEIYATSSLSGDVLAVTRFRYHCRSRYPLAGYDHGIDETDIAFNSNLTWNTGDINYNNLGSPYNFESVALHELGHALGLGPNHEDRWMATMNSYYPNSGTVGHWKEWTPLADDRRGAEFLYGSNGLQQPRVDIAGSVFKRTGNGTSGLVSSSLYAARGSYATMECTFSNHSRSRQTFDVGFYLSTDDIIQTSDRRLDVGNGYWVDSGVTFTISRSVYIPTTVTPGTYYLGFIVDYNGKISEYNESNNYMEMPRRITITASSALSKVDGSEEQQEANGVPAQYALEQNYPNPFNPETAIQYQLPEAGQVTLRIYNMLGEEVAAIQPGLVEAGYHRITWNGKSNQGKELASSIYLYRLEVQASSGKRFVETRKMNLLR